MENDEKMKKLRTYRRIKLNFGLEHYLENINDKAIRKCLSSFRISAHRLRIERGRYVRENIEDRLCLLCKTIDDEKHFLCHCAKYESQRALLYDTCKLKDLHVISKIDPEETFINLLTSNDMEVIIAVGKFIKECNIT